ncbi:MAG: 2-C-methyl-D-erythritol 4-phosphate cytidylyltransferase [bacterium]|nr:2-C-methyl-D-erythritol 4-phosphate cytidylyltransferase [bacterium]
MISVIIPSAGLGKRIGFKKQYYLLNKKPILAYTLSIFQNSPLISEIILAVPKDDIKFSKNNIVIKYKFNKVKKIVAGGKTRQISVSNGLNVCDPKSEYILVHDAVRPFFDKMLLPELIKEVKKYKAVVTAVPARDTIKIASPDKIIIKTPPRKDIYLAQTPQIFSHELIKKAYQKAFKEKFAGTDDSNLVERTGKKVKIFIGNEENIKITTLNDLEIAEILAANFFPSTCGPQWKRHDYQCKG